MESTVTLANWRTAPYSTQSFHRVDQIIPVAFIDASGRPSGLSADPTSLDAVVFEDQHGQQRRLTEVLDATATRGLVVLRGGRLVAERYLNGYDGTCPHILFSVSKSLTGALTGILVGRGRIDPDSPVTRYIPEVSGSAYGDCTVRHVLDMTVSSSFSEAYLDKSGDFARYRRAMLWNPAEPGEDTGTLHEFLASVRPAPEPHGAVFRYLSPNSDLLGWLVERASGRDFASLFSDLIWKPMGAEAGAYITVDAIGSPRTAGGICALPRDLARFGEIMRLGGNHILPDWWVQDIRSGGDSEPWKVGEFYHMLPTGRYRSQWYQSGSPSGAFCAIGIHGQWLWVDPQREVVIAKVSAQKDPVDEDTDFTLIRAFEAIAEAVQ
ncbi:serine hydrolase domain-containing protein [Desulfosarcina sp.]|uniref:serine hydrolase domain-containing protein n=1 Tax=Desulfosarcina sp. TaxID=2027861 RepID=UPI0035693907